MTDDSAFADWADTWMRLARYRGRDVPDVSDRIQAVLGRWTAPVPDGWYRPHDPRLHQPGLRYLRTHRHGAPRPGSEHELEHQILNVDPAVVRTECDGEVLIDGVNAVPLARDPDGGRRGNVEADMLLLTDGTSGYRQWLVEAKTQSNNAWYGVIECLRQLRLFTLSHSAQKIMPERQPKVPESTPVTALLLAPAGFYTAPGAKQRSVGPARELIDAMDRVTKIDIGLAVWDPPSRTISGL